jgi:hypothetical protein
MHWSRSHGRDGNVEVVGRWTDIGGPFAVSVFHRSMSVFKIFRGYERLAGPWPDASAGRLRLNWRGFMPTSRSLRCRASSTRRTDMGLWL